MYNCMEVIRKDYEVIGLIKAYTSFSGKGAFPTELKDKDGALLQKLDHEYENNTEKSELNRCGWLDFVVLRNFIQENQITSLAIRNLEVLGALHKQQVGENYLYHSRILKTLPEDREGCRPFYHEFFGMWQMENCKRWEDVPDRVKYYLHYIERKIGIPVKYITLGKRTDKLIPINSSENL